MCGIVGIWNRDGAPVDAGLLERLRDRLAHRGPDGAGLHLDDGLGLGHRRLAVLDPRAGVQPMHSPDGQAVIVYNGEVYNYRELRKELGALGHRFGTDCDTEVVLAAYREWGLESLRRLNGMFAFAIWDATAQRLVLARDRLGIKPLFVHEHAGGLAFASEPKALLGLPGLDTSWDEQALHDYFHFLYVPSPRTAWRAIRQLEPGSLLVADEHGVRRERYWELEPDPASAGALDELEALLRDAVSLRTVSDVPLGAFLSGGIDSGLVVAYLADALGPGVNTFTVFDPEVPYYDERKRARLVAERFETIHRELVAASEVESLAALIPTTFDQPFADSGALPNLVVCREGRRFVTVALSGLGGDEISGGYVRYLGASIGPALRWVPPWAGRALAAVLDRLPEGAGLAADRVKRFARLTGLEEAALYAGLVGAGGRLPRSLLADDFARRVDRGAPVARIERLLARGAELGLDRLNRLLYADLHSYLVDDLLPLADRTSMRVGLEVRVPFLDHRVVSRALAIPGREKVRGRRLKLPLRTLAARHLPAEVLTGPKRGFSVPMAAWLRGPLHDEMDRVVVEVAPATGVLDRDALRQAWRAHASGRASHESILWATLVFARWAEAG